MARIPAHRARNTAWRLGNWPVLKTARRREASRGFESHPRRLAKPNLGDYQRLSNERLAPEASPTSPLGSAETRLGLGRTGPQLGRRLGSVAWSGMATREASGRRSPERSPLGVALLIYQATVRDQPSWWADPIFWVGVIVTAAGALIFVWLVVPPRLTDRQARRARSEQLLQVLLHDVEASPRRRRCRGDASAPPPRSARRPRWRRDAHVCRDSQLVVSAKQSNGYVVMTTFPRACPSSR